MGFAATLLARLKGKELANLRHVEINNAILAEIAVSLEKLAGQEDSIKVVNAEDVSVGEAELAGFVYRTPGFGSHDRAWASRDTARALLQEYKIEKKS